MALEIEIKLRVDSHDPVRAKLQAVGATKLSCVIEHNTILDRPDGWLRGRGRGLRVRMTQAVDGGLVEATLTAKGPQLAGAMKSREELEIKVSDADMTVSIAETLGYVPILQYEKRRETWLLGDCKVELDEPPHIGYFVEIEGPGEAQISAVRLQLGLDRATVEPKTYVGLLMAYCVEQGMSSRVLTGS